MQPLAILSGAAFTAAVSFSLGALLLRNSAPDPATRFVTGASLLSLIVLAAAALHLIYPATFLILGAAAIAAARSEFRLPKRPRLTRWALLFAPFLVLYFFNAMAPEISYDGSRYHLSLIARILRDHGLRPNTDTFYAAFPQGVEMLYLFAFTFGRHSAAKLVHFTFLLALAWQVYGWCRGRGYPVAGIGAAALVFLSPIVGVDGTSAYIDVAVASIAFTLFSVLELWSERPSTRLLVAAGLLAGFACAAKYTAFVAVPYGVGYVLWRSRRVRLGFTVAAIAGMAVLPWLIKNYLWFQNPVAPFFNRYFPNPYVSASFEADYRSHLQQYNLRSPREIPLETTTYGSLDGLFGPVLLLAPIGLLALRYPEGRRILLAAAIFASTYPANISARFLIPAFPFISIAICLVLAQSLAILTLFLVIHGLFSWPAVIKRYAHADAWHLFKVPYREALRIKPEDGYLESNLPFYGITRRIEDQTPPNSTVYTETPIPDAYTSRRILVAWESTANILSKQLLYDGNIPELKRRGIDYLLMLEPRLDLQLVVEYKGAKLYKIQ